MRHGPAQHHDVIIVHRDRLDAVVDATLEALTSARRHTQLTMVDDELIPHAEWSKEGRIWLPLAPGHPYSTAAGRAGSNEFDSSVSPRTRARQ